MFIAVKIYLDIDYVEGLKFIKSFKNEEEMDKFKSRLRKIWEKSLKLYQKFGNKYRVKTWTNGINYFEIPDTKEQLIKNRITEWLTKQSHNRCWYYPEIFNEICKILDIKVDVDRNLPPRKEFRENCHKYEDEQYLSPEELKESDYGKYIDDLHGR